MTAPVGTVTVWYLAVVLLVVHGTQGYRYRTRGEPAHGPGISRAIEFRMPFYQPKVNDAYVCTGVSVESLFGTDKLVWVTQYKALSDANTAHHMLLFQCDGLTSQQKRDKMWDCGHHGVCENSRVMYAWAKNAPATRLPDNVGFKLGGDTNNKYLVLQIHYAHPLPSPDDSGVELTVTERPQKYQAGIYLLLSPFANIPANTPVTHSDNNCELEGKETLHAFASRVHAHALGKVITGYRYSVKNHTLVEMARGNPQWPQAFYPMKRVIDIEPGDYVHARCTFDSTGRNRSTHIGSTSADEMCNLYVMYYTDAKRGRSAYGCVGENIPELTAALPANSDEPLPPNPLLEEHAKHTHKEDMSKVMQYDAAKTGSGETGGHHAGQQAEGEAAKPGVATGDSDFRPENLDGSAPSMIGTVINPDQFETNRLGKALGGVDFVPNWGGSAHTFGQVSAVSVDTQGNVVIFHRASKAWDGNTFSGNRLRDTSKPIPENTIVYMKNDTGEIIFQMGARFFYLPHGLTVDHQDNVWCTDVGMHQVFKFGPRGGNGNPLMTLGTKFEPGDDASHFCKPTSVAVQRDGTFFVADGYCNHRILKYGPAGGQPLMTVGRASSTFAIFGSLLGRAPAVDEFNVPHSLTLAEGRDLVCTADRENGRVSCFRASDLAKTDLTVNWQRSRIFALAYSPHNGGALYVVNGPNYANNKIQGYIVDINTKAVVSVFSPSGNGLSNPHDVAVSHDGSAIYVAELNPQKVWKFVTNGPHGTQRKNIGPAASSGPHAQFVTSPLGGSTGAAGVSSQGKLVVGVLFAVPVVLFLIVMVVIRLRKRAQRQRFLMRNLNSGLGYKTSLGPLLGKKSRGDGFEPLSTEDLEEDSDSDVEEFIAKIKARA